MHVGRRISRRRRAAGYTQRTLAARARIPWHRLKHIEAGRRMPDAVTLARVAGALGCRTDDLLPPERPRKK